MLWFCVVAIAVIGVAIRVACCGTLRMSFVDFPVNELKTLDAAALLSAQTSGADRNTNVLSAAVRQIAGDGVCTLRSSMTATAGRFLPGTTFVDVLVNGKACSLQVDTGSHTTALFPRLAKRAEVPISKTPAWTWEKSDGQGATPVYTGLATSLVLGSFTISNVPVGVLGKQHEVRLLGLPVYHMDGLLGMDILQNFAVTFVLADGSVRLSRTAPLTAPHVKRLTFRLSKKTNMMITQAIMVNGQPIGDCLIDTGSSGKLVLTEATWNKLALGETLARVDLQMGDVSMNNVPAEKSDAIGMGMVPMNLLATKGTKTITIDFQAEQIIYE
ncbi:MAG: retropepsin-like aspartic protease [bacterium]